ncbi:MAG: hypothetical protein FWD87_03020 [Spirochaetaceae bacterium]|nr:hypothetical protein [Spirochaetaceae bacterium]
MKKIIGLIVLITLIGAGFAFAHGKDSERSNRKSKGERHQMTKTPRHSLLEIREISGIITVRNSNFHVIRSGGEDVRVILPLSAIQALKLNTGSQVSVKGIEVPAPRRGERNERIVRVFELQYDERKFLVLGNPRPGNERPGRVSR